MPELLTLKEICRRLKVHKATIYRWMKDNEFPRPSVKKRGIYRWNADDVEKSVAFSRNQ